jgi:hypothetical protein
MAEVLNLSRNEGNTLSIVGEASDGGYGAVGWFWAVFDVECSR